MMKLLEIVYVVLICFVPGEFFAMNRTNKSVDLVQDELISLQPNSVSMNGYLGEKLDLCIRNRILVQDIEILLDLFRLREADNLGFNAEFLGKWLIAAALAYQYQPNPQLKKKMTYAADELVKTSSADGYLTTYKKGDEFKEWDIWNQKYVLLGLISQYDLTGNIDYLKAAVASATHFMNNIGPEKISLDEHGHPAHRGGCNYSILEPIVLLYQRTGVQHFLDYADYIVSSWSNPGKYTENGVHFIENVQQGIPLVESEVAHAYTFMSNFEGLLELYRVTGKRRYLDTTVKMANQILKEELMIVGSVSNHESWYNGAVTQTEMLETPIETCATVTWMKLCYQLLRLTGNPQWADQLEVSLYNALLGSMMLEGEWWAYNSPLWGERVPSHQQGSHLSCCVSNGPRGLLLTPDWAMMKGANGDAVVNLYTSGETSLHMGNGRTVKFIQETDYPVHNGTRITILLDSPVKFTLKLRIPAWSKQSVIKVNGEVFTCEPGSYAVITRHWKKNDQVTVDLDFRGRIIRAPSGAPQHAIMRGPVVLAMDNRLISEQDSTVWLIAQPYKYETQIPNNGKGYIPPQRNFSKAGEEAFIELKPVESADKSIRMAFEVPFLVRPWHFFLHHQKPLVLCDFASAGNRWSEDNLFRVWIPQPMFMGNIYPKGAGGVMSLSKPRSVVPNYIRNAVYGSPGNK